MHRTTMNTRNTLFPLPLIKDAFRPLALALMLPVVALLTACQSLPRAETDYIEEHDFSGYKTFSIIRNPPGLQVRNPAISPNIVRKMHRITTDILVSKGFRRVEDPAQADFQVVVHGEVKDRIDVDHYGYATRRWHYYHGIFIDDVDAYKEGILIVDVVDAATQELVWRGMARRIKNNDRLDPTLIENGLRDILENFPPPPAAPQA